MKLLTLNTHSLVEKDWEIKLEILAEAIISEDYDVVALQEVNQPVNEDGMWAKYPIVTNYTLKNGNYMLKLQKILDKNSQNYKSVWCGFKKSYGLYQEGVGIITKCDIDSIKSVELTKGMIMPQWKRRYALGIKTVMGDFFTTHMGWWDDEDAPFLHQWNRLYASVDNKKTWIMGDFNCESYKKGESYDLVTSSGFYDSYVLAKIRDSGFTVCDKIDGWQDEKSKRIDYIFCNYPAKVKASHTIFNGKNYGVVSDHFGVTIETEE